MYKRGIKFSHLFSKLKTFNNRKKQFTLKYIFTITQSSGALHSCHYRLCHAYTPTHISMSPCAPGDVHMHTTQLYLLGGGGLLKNNSLIISGQVVFPHNTMKYIYIHIYIYNAGAQFLAYMRLARYANYSRCTSSLHSSRKTFSVALKI